MGRRNDQMVVSASRAEVRAAIDALPQELTWDQVSTGLRPMFVRRRPMPPGAEKPLMFHKPPGVNVALGVDIGPAFLYVGASMVATWQVTAEEAYERAIANLRASVADE